jgi:hypothetical protein
VNNFLSDLNTEQEMSEFVTEEESMKTNREDIVRSSEEIGYFNQEEDNLVLKEIFEIVPNFDEEANESEDERNSRSFPNEVSNDSASGSNQQNDQSFLDISETMKNPEEVQEKKLSDTESHNEDDHLAPTDVFFLQSSGEENEKTGQTSEQKSVEN